MAPTIIVQQRPIDITSFSYSFNKYYNCTTSISQFNSSSTLRRTCRKDINHFTSCIEADPIEQRYFECCEDSAFGLTEVEIYTFKTHDSNDIQNPRIVAIFARLGLDHAHDDDDTGWNNATTLKKCRASEFVYQ